MSVHKFQVLWVGLLAMGFLFVGCQNTREAAAGSATAATFTPAIASYGSAYGVNNLKQDLLIASAADAEALAEEISYEQMVELSRGHDASGFWVVAEWKYMGTKQGHHFLAYYPPLFGMRKIYRIRESQYKITQPFGLTALSTSWRPIQPLGPESAPTYEYLKLQPWWQPPFMTTNLSPWEPVPFGYDLSPAAKPGKPKAGQ